MGESRTGLAIRLRTLKLSATATLASWSSSEASDVSAPSDPLEESPALPPEVLA